MLHTEGYVVHHNIFATQALINTLPTIVGDKASIATQVIFNNKKHGGDKKRLQTPLNINGPLPVKAFRRTVQSFVRKHYPHHVPNSMVVLTSMSLCQSQLAQCDYEPSVEFAKTSDDNIPLGCLIALESGTKLKVWPKSIRLSTMNEYIRSDYIEEYGGPIKPIEVTLNPGDALVFRGDLVHAGAAYAQKNNRVHLYLDSPDVPRPDNVTWFPSDSWIDDAMVV